MICNTVWGTLCLVILYTLEDIMAYNTANSFAHNIKGKELWSNIYLTQIYKTHTRLTITFNTPWSLQQNLTITFVINWL